MLILCSDGLSSEKLRNSIYADLSNCRSAALVVTADPVYKDRNYHVKRCIEELRFFGLTVSLFDLDEQPSHLLLDYDVVEFIGGNPFYLLNSIRENQAADILRKIADNRVLIGWSAAAFVFGPSVELVHMYSPEMNFADLSNLQGISLTNIEVLPHYEKFCDLFERFEERCLDYERIHGINVIRLNDGDGVIIRGSEVVVSRADT